MRDSEGVCVYVEGVNRKSRILFSFQLLLIDDNETRLVSRSLRRRNHACKYIPVHVTWTATATCIYTHISIIHVSITMLSW